MKYFYLIILTLFTITHIDDAASSAPLDEGLAAALATAQGVKKVHSPPRVLERTPTHSDTGSHAGSRASFASTILRDLVPFDHTGINLTDPNALLQAYIRRLTGAYNSLLKIIGQVDTQCGRLVQGLEQTLPGIIRNEGESDLVVLQQGFQQLVKMYKSLKKAHDAKTGNAALLESTIAELRAGQEALQVTIAKMAPRPTEFAGTEMSPPRLAALKAAAVEESDVVVGLRARVTELEAAAAERDRLATENATALETAAAEKDRLVV